MAYLTISLTALGQPSSRTDSITISRDQQRQCIKWHDEVDSLRLNIIPAKDSIISKQDQFIERTELKLYESEKKRNAAENRAADQERKKKNAWKIGVPGGFLGGFFFAFWLFVK